MLCFRRDSKSRAIVYSLTTSSMDFQLCFIRCNYKLYILCYCTFLLLLVTYGLSFRHVCIWHTFFAALLPDLYCIWPYYMFYVNYMLFPSQVWHISFFASICKFVALPWAYKVSCRALKTASSINISNRRKTHNFRVVLSSICVWSELQSRYWMLVCSLHMSLMFQCFHSLAFSLTK